jgi:hypothetical protein
VSASTTPDPVYAPNDLKVDPANQVGSMQYPEKARFRAAAHRVRTAIPGPIGECVARELLTIEEFGWMLGAESFGTKLLLAVEELPSPTTVKAQSAVRAGFIVPNETK